jgi:DNA polymerase (family 10)
MWPEEAVTVHRAGRSLTELRAVGPWLAHLIEEWLEVEPDVPEPPEERRGFITVATARETLARHRDWRSALRADLQMHTTYSDGAASLRQMVEAARGYGYEFVAITDHSKGLPIARGMPEEKLARQGREIDELNAELETNQLAMRVLRSLEMNLSPEGEGDMEQSTLASLDLVLGAFHSKLRVLEDQTERYLAAVRNPMVHVLAHPRGRRWGARLGLRADWPRVFEEAAAHRTALEIDCFPDRQDLDVELLKVAREAGAFISIGTDAHDPAELRFMDLGLASAILADLPRERILNFMTMDRLLEWAGTGVAHRGRSGVVPRWE